MGCFWGNSKDAELRVFDNIVIILFSNSNPHILVKDNESNVLTVFCVCVRFHARLINKKNTTRPRKVV